MHERNAEHISGGKEPAAAAAPLVGDGRALEGDADVVDLLVGDLGGARGENVPRVRGGKSRESESV